MVFWSFLSPKWGISIHFGEEAQEYEPHHQVFLKRGRAGRREFITVIDEHDNSNNCALVTYQQLIDNGLRLLGNVQRIVPRVALINHKMVGGPRPRQSPQPVVRMPPSGQRPKRPRRKASSTQPSRITAVSTSTTPVSTSSLRGHHPRAVP